MPVIILSKDGYKRVVLVLSGDHLGYVFGLQVLGVGL